MLLVLNQPFIDCTVNPPAILRQGAITLELVNSALRHTGIVATEEFTGESRCARHETFSFTHHLQLLNFLRTEMLSLRMRSNVY